jgi:maleylpyruvate isomerase
VTAARTHADALTWMRDGTVTFIESAAGIPPEDWSRPSGLPGWTRSNVVAHVAANAEAISNLVRWALTGERTPMYASPQERARGIALGDRLSPHELTTWLRDSAAGLQSLLDQMTDASWGEEVLTAQGRVVPASEVPWLRTREVWVHAVDLHGRTTFADFPQRLLTSLHVDISAKRGEVPTITGPSAEVVAYLAGRPFTQVTTSAGRPPPDLAPWL